MEDFRVHILDLCKKGEGTEVEFKSAKGGFPQSFWETYSAFANTEGGYIILGIKESGDELVPDQMDEATAKKYLKIFWDNAHNRNKISACLPKESDVHIEEIDGSFVLACYIPRAAYNIKPVYLTTNPQGNTYRRDHEGDYRCSDAEVRRMFADSEIDQHPQDGRILKKYTVEKDIDPKSLHGYRQNMRLMQLDHPWNDISDLEFLKKIGAYSTDPDTEEEGLTIAGLLMFGKYDSIIRRLPNYFVDYRESLNVNDPATRWTDRIYSDGLWEANLYQFYIRVYNKLIQAIPRPFQLKNGRRVEETPAHVAIREALQNCLIHQDIAGMGGIIIERTDDALTFSNPGLMLISKDQFFKGGKSICRNRTLQSMFMRLGGAEKAGSGADKILKGWKYLGYGKPILEEQTRPDYVELKLKLVANKASSKGFSDNFSDNFSGKLSPRQIQVLELLWKDNTLTATQLAEQLSVSRMTINKAIAVLKEVGLIKRVGPDKGGHWEIIQD